MIYSSSGIYALGQLGDKTHFVNRHLLFLCIGLLTSFAIMAFDYRELRVMVKPLMFFVFVMLVLVLIPIVGKAHFGARRWFQIGPFSFQPSEFAKLAILVYVADFLARKQNRIKDFFEGFLPPIIVVGIFSFLIVKQPDLGNAVLIVVIVLIVMYAAGAQIAHIGILILSALPVAIMLVVMVPWRLRRIMAFVNPDTDAQGVGFQLAQSKIALGSGGFFWCWFRRKCAETFLSSGCPHGFYFFDHR